MALTYPKIKLLIVALVILLTVFGPSLTLAQAPTNTLNANTKAKIVELATGIKNKMEATLLRLQNIGNGISTVANKNSATGQPNQVTDTLIEANALISSSSQSLQGIDGAISKVVNSDDPVASWSIVRNQFFAVESNIKQSYQKLNDAFLIISRQNNYNIEPVLASTSSSTVDIKSATSTATTTAN